jgi:hypothetical protein
MVQAHTLFESRTCPELRASLPLPQVTPWSYVNRLAMSSYRTAGSRRSLRLRAIVRELGEKARRGCVTRQYFG